MNAAAQVRPASEMNVTPMLDVLLVLLVIFMMVAIGMRKSVDAQLPQPCVGGCADGVPIVLEVLPGPAYRLNGTPIAPDRLAARLAAVYAGRADRSLQIAGDRGATYQQVIAAMDVARGAGVKALGLRTPDRAPAP